MFKKSQITIKTVILTFGIFFFIAVFFTGAMKYTERSNFCITCHAMEPMFETWNNSTHASRASCNDCHAPSDTGSKYIFKATSGTGHLYANIMGAPENIKATENSVEIIQQNCLKCHGELVADTQMGGGKYCVDCHRSTPHGP